MSRLRSLATIRSPACPYCRATLGVINSTYVQETKDSAADRPSGITFAMPIQPAIEMLKKAGLEP